MEKSIFEEIYFKEKKLPEWYKVVAICRAYWILFLLFSFFYILWFFIQNPIAVMSTFYKEVIPVFSIILPAIIYNAFQVFREYKLSLNASKLKMLKAYGVLIYAGILLLGNHEFCRFAKDFFSPITLVFIALFYFITIFILLIDSKYLLDRLIAYNTKELKN